MNIAFASVSNAGPRSVNEDFLDYWVAKSGETVACVADGLGGMGGGNIASELAISQFKDHLRDGIYTEEAMVAAARVAHEAIRAAQKEGATNRMATTLTAVALKYDRVLGVHCGDSRAVILRGKGIKRLTNDHSEGQRLFDAGKLTKDEFVNYPRKHILESALGDSDAPRIDPFHFDLFPGDRIVLTTDGVHNLLLLRELQNLSAKSATPSALVDSVTKTIKERGATDNYSLIALFAD